MRTELYTYNHNQQVARPAFGAIKYEQAEDTLRTVLSSKELKELRVIISTEKMNHSVDLHLFGEGKKLSANISDDAALQVKDSRVKSYSQRFWESPMAFIKRMLKKVKKRTPEVKELLAKQNFNFE